MREEPDVHRITTAQPGLSKDVDGRMHRYAISMGIRTLCFLGSVFVISVLHWTIVGCVLLVGAIGLPYVAVVMANAGRERVDREEPLDMLPDDHRQQLGG